MDLNWVATRMCTFSHGKSIRPVLWHFRVFIFAISGYTYFEMITAGALITETMGELKETRLLKILKSCQVFDGFTFWNFGQIFEAIFYEKKLGIKFLMMDLPSGILVKCLKRFSTRKKFCIKFLTMDLFSMGFTFDFWSNFGSIFFMRKKLRIQFLTMDFSGREIA